MNTIQLYFAQSMLVSRCLCVSLTLLRTVLLYLRAFAAWERNKIVGVIAAAMLLVRLSF